MTILASIAGVLVGAVYAAWRLKGNRTWAQAARRIVPLGGGGPGEPTK